MENSDFYQNCYLRICRLTLQFLSNYHYCTTCNFMVLWPIQTSWKSVSFPIEWAIWFSILRDEKLISIYNSKINNSVKTESGTNPANYWWRDLAVHEGRATWSFQWGLLAQTSYTHDKNAQMNYEIASLLILWKISIKNLHGQRQFQWHFNFKHSELLTL